MFWSSIETKLLAPFPKIMLGTSKYPRILDPANANACYIYCTLYEYVLKYLECLALLDNSELLKIILLKAVGNPKFFKGGSTTIKRRIKLFLKKFKNILQKNYFNF